MTDHTPIPMRVVVQGAVLVNGAVIVRDYGDCLLVAVDLRTKYAEYACDSFGTVEGPQVYLFASPYTLKLDENQPRDAMTAIEFHEHPGWRVYAKYGPNRYTLKLVLLAPEAAP
jgi:hypothetical protein